jgi:hypothetical protein
MYKKNIYFKLIAINILFILFNTFFAAKVFSQDVVPKLINYQGKLTDAAGAPLGGAEGGVFTLRFEIFPVATGGNATWAETRTANVVGGVFNVVLGGNGSTNTVGDLGAAFTGKDRFLQTTVVSGPGVASPQTLLPRQQLASVPFAFETNTAAFADVAARAVTSDDSSKFGGQDPAFYSPPGTIVAYIGDVAPSGWYLCHGGEVPRGGVNAQLESIIGQKFGLATNAATHFKLPDFRGLFLRGVDRGKGVDPDRSVRGPLHTGGATGDAVGSYQADEIKSHSHPYRDTTIGDWRGLSVDGSGTTTEYWAWGATSLTGGNETRPKNVYVNYIIKY